jgi:hypothetical protein
MKQAVKPGGDETVRVVRNGGDGFAWAWKPTTRSLFSASQRGDPAFPRRTMTSTRRSTVGQRPSCAMAAISLENIRPSERFPGQRAGPGSGRTIPQVGCAEGVSNLMGGRSSDVRTAKRTSAIRSRSAGP